jgi:glycosyltransferase involved in cell wall biosynthesis/predicted flap endonuclease-1-like 5' DNA nuclease
MRTEESGIRRVVEAYVKYLPNHGIEVVEDPNIAELTVAHAGTFVGANVVHCHGLYWSDEYEVAKWELHTNRNVIESIRSAVTVSVPSKWVAETFERDMRMSPVVIPHGVDWSEWQHTYRNEGYVLWNKNRSMDVCSPYPVGVLADRFPNVTFATTFSPDKKQRNNMGTIGTINHDEMKRTVQRSAVYLATTKETFGIGILEAMAAGVPILGFAHGGVLEMVEHGVSGYLAKPNDYDDLALGLQYCLSNRDILSANARSRAKLWTWETAVEKVAELYRETLDKINQPSGVSVIIPTYNYGDKVERAIRSATEQNYKPDEVIVVDDGSTDNTKDVLPSIIDTVVQDTGVPVRYIRQENQGVAVARNRGIAESKSKYVCCLDADDAIDPRFLEECVKPLEHDRSIGITYTGLQYIKPDGETGKSPWPSEFNYDAQLLRKNQIPTCCVFRKEMWERLGGYNQKFAPGGAGSEDAEFWLRAGAYGWSAKMVTAGPLFIYSWMSGRVSGDPDYKEIDWLSSHPWVKDKQYPFASLASPKNGISHLVRQYDMPVVSVVIPVGKTHARQLVDALDSLESQTFRYWEAIVVLDGTKFNEEPGMQYVPEGIEAIKKAYPYVKFIETGGLGAGAARNIGAEHARGKFLLFLDADDWMYPSAIKELLEGWNDTGYITYSDYVGKAFISPEEVTKLGNRVLHYNEKTQEAVIKHYSADFDCERAVSQPQNDGRNTYIWSLVTCLVPKAWHNEIGGFDESMESWEDWDYWIRMARAGRCFHRVEKDLVVYRFYTGSRRDAGLHQYQNLLKYMLEKKKEAIIMACGCSSNKRPPVMATPYQKSASALATMEKNMNDESMVLVVYDSQNMGQHKVIGPASKTFYGYRSGGEKFYVNRSDAAAAPHVFKAIPERITEQQVTAPPEPIEETPPPQPIEEEMVAIEQDSAEELGEHLEAIEEETFDYHPIVEDENGEVDLQSVGGITEQIADALEARGIKTKEDIIALGVEGLQEVKGIGKIRAEAIIASVLTED